MNMLPADAVARDLHFVDFSSQEVDTSQNVGQDILFD